MKRYRYTRLSDYAAKLHGLDDIGDEASDGEEFVPFEQARSAVELLHCGHVGDGPTYSCLLCGHDGTDHPVLLRRALTEARDELVRYIDFMHKHDYREYAAPVEAKVSAINALLA